MFHFFFVILRPDLFYIIEIRVTSVLRVALPNT